MNRKDLTIYEVTTSISDPMASQDKFSEAFFPTKTIAPNDGGQYEMTTCHTESKHVIIAAQISNSSNAVAELINYAEQLESMDKGVEIDLDTYGCTLVTPYFDRETIDLTDRHHPQDVAKVLVDAIRNHAYKMYRDSNYGPAMQVTSAGTADKPKVLIGCDAVIEHHLNVIIHDDPHLLGEHMDYEVVSTTNERMAGKIFLTFTNPHPDNNYLLGFGVHAYVPELTRLDNNNVHRSERVPARSAHIPVLPILVQLNVRIQIRDSFDDPS